MHLRISLKAILALLFGLLALISALQGGLTLRELAAIREAATSVATNWIPSLATVSAIEVDASEVRIKQYRLVLLSASPELRAKNAANLEMTHDRLRKA